MTKLSACLGLLLVLLAGLQVKGDDGCYKDKDKRVRCSKTIERTCYFLLKESHTYSNATQMCKTLKGQMAVLDTKEKQDKVALFADDNEANQFWVKSTSKGNYCHVQNRKYNWKSGDKTESRRVMCEKA